MFEQTYHITLPVILPMTGFITVVSFSAVRDPNFDRLRRSLLGIFLRTI
jgi:ABC-type sugar transport system permease subunit